MKVRSILFRPYMKPADDLSGGGGGVDRGDEWTPTEAKGPAPKDEPKDEPKDAPKDEPKAESEGEEGEGEEGDEKEEKGAKKKRDDRIPVSRHKEILDRERERREALERQVAELTKGSQVAKTNEQITADEEKVVTLEAEYLKLLAEGDVKGAAAKMAEIRRTERQIVEATSRMEIEAAEARAYERVKYDTTVERLEEAYPVINPDHEDYDKEVVAEVVELRDGYFATGKYTRAQALQKAVQRLLKPATKRQEAATTVDVRPDKDDVAKAVREERKSEAVKKGAEVTAKQPASLAGVGTDSDKAGGRLKAEDVIKLDQGAFAKLSEADLAKLRGDDL